jgi:peptide deformylase
VAIRDILAWPDPLLLRACVPVAAFNEDLMSLVRDMVETMYAANGVGLAANQVGVPLQLVVIDTSGGRDPEARIAACNPEVVWDDGEQEGEEGCLSLPGVTETVVRPLRLRIRYLDLDGSPVEAEAEDLLARAWCHEIDHIRGRTILDRVSSLRRSLLKRGIQKRIRSGTWV